MFWLLAANDKSLISGSCGGCIQLLHQFLQGLPGALNDFYRLRLDAFPILVAFGVICGCGWIAASILAFINSKSFLVVGALTYIVHAVLFPIIFQRIKSDLPCTYYLSLQNPTLPSSAWNIGGCNVSNDWYVRHKYDSYDFFWAGGLICFLLGAYQLSCATAMCWTEEKLAEEERNKAMKPQSFAIQVPEGQSNPIPQEQAPHEVIEEKPKAIQEEHVVPGTLVEEKVVIEPEARKEPEIVEAKPVEEKKEITEVLDEQVKENAGKQQISQSVLHESALAGLGLEAPEVEPEVKGASLFYNPREK